MTKPTAMNCHNTSASVVTLKTYSRLFCTIQHTPLCRSPVSHFVDLYQAQMQRRAYISLNNDLR